MRLEEQYVRSMLALNELARQPAVKAERRKSSKSAMQRALEMAGVSGKPAKKRWPRLRGPAGIRVDVASSHAVGFVS